MSCDIYKICVNFYQFRTERSGVITKEFLLKISPAPTRNTK